MRSIDFKLANLITDYLSRAVRSSCELNIKYELGFLQTLGVISFFDKTSVEIGGWGVGGEASIRGT